MWNNQAEVEDVLNVGRQILNQHPEMVSLSYDQVLDALDDGADEMVHYRWGVIAQIIIDSIANWEMQDLVMFLAKIKCANLTREYVGYALQCRCGIALEDLVIEAEKHGLFEKIIPYVSRNLSYLPFLHTQSLLPFLLVINNHRAHSSYYSTLLCLAQGIDSCNSFPDVMRLIQPLNDETQYKLFYNMRRCKYAEENFIALIETFLSQATLYSWKAAIDYCEWFLPLNKALLNDFYSRIINVAKGNAEREKDIVPLLVEDIIQTASAKDSHPIFQTVLCDLKLILLSNPSAKTKFLEKVAYTTNWPEEIHSLFKSILSLPADDIDLTCYYLDTCFSILLEHDDSHIALDEMLTFFSTNKFRDDYMKFFDRMNTVLPSLANHIENISQIAIGYIIKPDVDCMFFGLGLFVHLGGMKKMPEVLSGRGIYENSFFSEKELIRVMKAVLFYSFDDTQICNTAFNLLSYIQGRADHYISSCMDVVFNNYPDRLYEIALHYESSDRKPYRTMAERIIHSYSERMDILEKAKSIPDLQPSNEHQLIYRHAQHERSRILSKQANEEPSLMKLFSQRHLKYGKRSGHIIHGKKEQQFYQTSPYHVFQQSIYMPELYTSDPVLFQMQRGELLEEVNEDAFDN